MCVSVSCLHATPSHYFILIYFDVTSGQVPSLISFKSCLYHFLYIFLSRWILAAAFLVPWKIFLGLRLELHWIDWYLFHTHEQVSISPLIPAFVRSLLFFKKMYLYHDIKVSPKGIQPNRERICTSAITYVILPVNINGQTSSCRPDAHEWLGGLLGDFSHKQ